MEDNPNAEDSVAVNNFVRESQNIEKEIICVAHELGHHFSLNVQIDSAYDEMRENGCYVSKEQKDLVLSEETFAWLKAWEILVNLGFENDVAFKKEQRIGMESYLNISICS